MDETVNPWKTLSTRSVFETPWLSVIDAKAIDPSGRPCGYGYVRMKKKATGVIPIDRQGFTVLVGQYRYVLDRYSWEIVEGGAEVGDSFEAGARRELAEEAGLTAAHWLEILRLDLSNALTDEGAATFVAWDLSEVTAAPESCEQLALRRVALQEAMEMVLDGRITDAVSVASLLKLDALHRARRLPDELLDLLNR